MEPVFRYMKNGEVKMMPSIEAKIEGARKKSGFAQPDEIVMKTAIDTVRRAGGDTSCMKHVLGHYTIQFGKYLGFSFKWILENDIEYGAYLVSGMKGETETDAPLSKNKHAFRKYFLLFPECLSALHLRKRFKEVPKIPPQQTVPRSQPFDVSDVTDEELMMEASKIERNMTLGEHVATFIIPRQPGDHLTQTELESVLSKSATVATATDTIIPDISNKQQSVVSKVSSKSADTASANLKTLESLDRQVPLLVEEQPCEELSVASSVVLQHCEQDSKLPSSDSLTPLIPVTSGLTDKEVIASLTTFSSQVCDLTTENQSQEAPSLSSVLRPPETEYLIPTSWRSSVPDIDQRWISKSVFTRNVHGNPEVDLRKVNKLWWSPPQPQLIPTTPPRLDQYFGHRLLLWMPKKLWKVKLFCPHCKTVELKSSGLYRKTRMVLDIDSHYILGTESLCCKKCHRFLIGWSNPVLEQLDPGHRSQFPVIITRKLSCDIRVIRLLRQRGFGNSPTLLYKKLLEQHDESRLMKEIQYMTDCSSFKRADVNKLITEWTAQRPPPRTPVPKYQWLQFVYCLDVLQRLDEVKASVTSVFGRVLKMDSTKKITKKLAGHAQDTAGWCTNISNEYGQILQTVMTTGEGKALEPLIRGITKRYEDAEVTPPEILYVDSQCCGNSPISGTFKSAWPNLHVRLDIWHFMRRLAVGVTTDTHRLYATFMGQLSHCIFEWDHSDLTLLKKAKRSQMSLSHIEGTSEEDIVRSLTRKELALHCRRSTRGEKETRKLIKSLLQMFDSNRGCDTMGVPLLHHDRIWEQWKKQKEHIPCIQDPPGIPLYTQTGTLKKGNVVLPVYRCARGSTSLESFHLHLVHFIPGSTINSANFQAYVVEGVRRWNEDRAAAAVREEPGVRGYTVYNSQLQYAANQLALDVFGETLIPNFRPPKKYTGEKIGIEYLFSQTGIIMDNPLTEDPEVPESSSNVEEEAEDEEVDDEGFVDADINVEDMTVPFPPVPAENTVQPKQPGQHMTEAQPLTAACRQTVPTEPTVQPKQPGQPMTEAGPLTAACRQTFPTETTVQLNQPGQPMTEAQPLTAACRRTVPTETTVQPNQPGQPMTEAGPLTAACRQTVPTETTDQPKQPGQPMTEAGPLTAACRRTFPTETTVQPKQPGQPMTEAGPLTAACWQTVPTETTVQPKQPGQPMTEARPLTAACRRTVPTETTVQPKQPSQPMTEAGPLTAACRRTVTTETTVQPKQPGQPMTEARPFAAAYQRTVTTETTVQPNQPCQPMTEARPLTAACPSPEARPMSVQQPVTQSQQPLVLLIPPTQPLVQSQQTEPHQFMLQNRPSQLYLQSPILPSSTTAVTSVLSGTPTVLVPTTVITTRTEAPTLVAPIPTAVVTEQQEALGPGNIGGYDKVEALAEFLVSLLQNKPQVITTQQADEIIGLWNDMHPYDKTTKFPAKYKPTLISGRFKQPKQKRLETTPGVLSVKRCFLGSNRGPAQWPDCNRYVEAVVTKLCVMHPSPTKKDGQRQCKWQIIMREYETLRNMVDAAEKVVRNTTIQLFSLNQKTIQSWFNKKDKMRDRVILEQGLSLQVPKIAAEPLPCALQKPAVLSSGAVSAEHQFQLQPNTTGQAQNVRRRILPELRPTVLVPILPKPVCLPTIAAGITMTQTAVPSTTLTHISYSTQKYNKRKLENEAKGIFKRKYTKTATIRKCGQCGKDEKTGGHVKYFSNLYCPEKCSDTLEDWKAPLKEKYSKTSKKN